MINPTQIRTAFEGIVGVRQPSDVDYAVFDATNTAPTSGYVLDEVRFFKGEYFVDAVASVGDDNATINTKFKDLVKDAALNVVNRVFNKVDFVQQGMFYTHANNFVKLETGLQNGFIGYRLELDDDKDLAFKINQVWLELSGAGDVEIILWNSNSIEPIKTQTETIDGTKKSYRVALGWEIDNVEYYKGDYYIGFLYNGTLTPYERTYESSAVKNTIKGIEYRSVNFPNHATNDLPNLDNEFDLGGKSVGMNLDISVYYDYTAFTIQNTKLFARAIQFQAAVMVLNAFVSSNRSNINERYSSGLKANILAALSGTRGDGINEKGLERQLASEISTLQDEIEKLRKGQNGSSNQIFVGTLC